MPSTQKWQPGRRITVDEQWCVGRSVQVGGRTLGGDPVGELSWGVDPGLAFGGFVSLLRCIDRKIILLYLDHHVRAMTTLFPPRGSERWLADLTFRFFVPVFFGLVRWLTIACTPPQLPLFNIWWKLEVLLKSRVWNKPGIFVVNSTGFNIPTHDIKRALSHDFRYPICTSTEMGDIEGGGRESDRGKWDRGE